ncbi:MAG: UDP-N-acetylglucosamine--N-acetylmuramyl-(pentapeptide) pyrophosphoryl-undecaprenol N-acetylglucosamine transferase, partial [Alphaproteobacteria bacterium]|nr:UDP-N-acetylglucosamine--N-acetylmuramyl-(pentapeptide) pyrophosphoryl-undecaprenol N-acetylglucosamine transferase [Alphaproteobacteria bacterium]
MSARIVLAAGGTGGHVFPAQALARELKGRGRSLVLMTDRRGTGYGDALDGLETVAVRAATPIGKHGLARLGALLDTVIGTFQARAALTRLRPAAVVGFGGYPALPTLLAAVRAGVPTLIHEQNAVLGRVNRLLAPLVGAIALSVGETLGLRARDWGKTRVVGNPVREAVVRLRAVPYEPPTEGGPVRLLVFGGSQGAAVLARLVPAAMGLLPAALRSRFAIVQQCRAEDRAATAARYRECGTAAELAPFFADLPERMAAAHLVIARAGASTVSELAVIGRPAVLVPL